VGYVSTFRRKGVLELFFNKKGSFWGFFRSMFSKNYLSQKKRKNRGFFSKHVPGLIRHSIKQQMMCMFRFDPYTNRWINDIAPMNTARAYARAAVLDGVIYVVGGKSGVDNYLSTAEK